MDEPQNVLEREGVCKIWELRNDFAVKQISTEQASKHPIHCVTCILFIYASSETAPALSGTGTLTLSSTLILSFTHPKYRLTEFLMLLLLPQVLVFIDTSNFYPVDFELLCPSSQILVSSFPSSCPVPFFFPSSLEFIRHFYQLFPIFARKKTISSSNLRWLKLQLVSLISIFFSLFF